MEINLPVSPIFGRTSPVNGSPNLKGILALGVWPDREALALQASICGFESHYLHKRGSITDKPDWPLTARTTLLIRWGRDGTAADIRGIVL